MIRGGIRENIKRCQDRIVNDLSTTYAYPAISIFLDIDGRGTTRTDDFGL
jgi:hypothetical protein